MIAPRFAGWRASVNRYAALYLVTLFVIVPLDFLFLGVVAKDFFASQVGNMLGEIKLAPAILFYLLYVAGTVIFVSGGQGASPDISHHQSWANGLGYREPFSS